MADKERVDLPGDFDALLRRTLAVEPSPEFLARVRERVREERRLSWWMAPWILTGGAAAATLAIAIGFTLLPGPTVSPQLPDAPAVRIASIERPVPKLPLIQRAAPSRPRVVTARSARGAAELPTAPVVIVDQRQRAALGLFVRMAQQGSLNEENLAQVEPTSHQPIEEQVLPIVVEPVVVSPIPVGGVLHNEVERR
jgi:hypothetical protein